MSAWSLFGLVAHGLDWGVHRVAQRSVWLGLNVGLIWRGNPKHGNDRLRSVDPAELAPLFGVNGIVITSYSIHYTKLYDRMPWVSWVQSQLLQPHGS